MSGASRPTADRGGDASLRCRVARDWLLPLAAALLSLVLVTGLTVGLELALGIPVNGFEIAVAASAMSVGLGVWLARLHGRRWPVAWLVLTGAVVLVVLPNLVLGGRVLDPTWDGQWYHQEAVIQLADGWNPYRADLGAERVPYEGARIRINGYPKATWLWGASLYRLTDRIERAKAFSLPLMVAAGLATVGCLLIVTRLSTPVAISIGLVAAANPVASTQFLNAFQDGAMGSLMTFCVASLALWVRAGSRAGLVLATAAGVGAAAVKLTGPLYVAILVSGAVVWLWQRGRWRAERCALAVAIGLAAVGLVLLSGGSFVTNAIRHGHPMYPALGPEAVTIVTAPPHDRLASLAASLFVRSQPADDDRDAVERLRRWHDVKRPFSVDRDELEGFFNPLVRIGGWGPLFGGAVLLTVLLLVAAAVVRPGRAATAMLATVPVVLSVLVNPYCWKARYVPQSWLVPLIAVVVVLARRPSRVERFIAVAVVITAGVNAALVATAHVPAVVRHSVELKHRLLDLARSRDPLAVNFYPFRSNRVRLAELGIAFEEVADYRFNLPVYLGYTTSRITHLELEPAAEGGGVALLAWSGTAGAERYVVEVLDPGAAGPGGSVLTMVRRSTSALRERVPVPARPVILLVRVCNALGCGVADTAGPVAAAGPGRPAPILGVPERNAVVTDAAILFSWLPASQSAAGGAPRYRFRLEAEDGGMVVLETETTELWAVHRLAEDRQWRARVSVIGRPPSAGSEIRFRTAGVATPGIIRPATGAEAVEGTVELAWSEVAGASAYEYFVAVEGEPDASVRGVTRATRTEIELPARDGRPTRYSIIVRACREATVCRAGSEHGWGPWTTDAGLGDVKLTVVPGGGAL